MADPKILKLLLVEDDLEDEQLIREALIEIEEHRHWCNWRSSDLVHVERLSDALHCLREESFHAVLLNLSLPDSPALLDSFVEVNSIARNAPIVVLADQEDENLAHRLLRAGAQDVLLKSELECAPLARSLRYAIERQRRTGALESAPFLDDLTGALTRPGFLAIAEHYARLAQRSGDSLLMGSIELAGILENGRQDRESQELLLIETAELLRGAFDGAVLIGRADRRRFGLVTVGLTETTAEALLNGVAVKVESVASRDGRYPVTVRFRVAELKPESATDLEELLGEDEERFTARTHRRTKTAMLAD